MKMRKYVVMAIDELGCKYRPSIFADMVFEFPDFKSNDYAMLSALGAWEHACMEMVMERVKEHHPNGWECSPFLELDNNEITLDDYDWIEPDEIW